MSEKNYVNAGYLLQKLSNKSFEVKAYLKDENSNDLLNFGEYFGDDIDEALKQLFQLTTNAIKKGDSKFTIHINLLD